MKFINKIHWICSFRLQLRHIVNSKIEIPGIPLNYTRSFQEDQKSNYDNSRENQRVAMNNINIINIQEQQPLYLTEGTP